MEVLIVEDVGVQAAAGEADAEGSLVWGRVGWGVSGRGVLLGAPCGEAPALTRFSPHPASPAASSPRTRSWRVP